MNWASSSCLVSLCCDQLELQPGDDNPKPFSFLTDRLDVEQLPCYVTYTNERVHDLIRANLHRASSNGSAALVAADCLGKGRAILTACGSLKSCCSRRR